MTTPEENAAKTEKTDQVLGREDGRDRRKGKGGPDGGERTAVGAALQEAMDESGQDRDDLTGR